MMSNYVRDYYNQNAEREWRRPDTPLSKQENPVAYANVVEAAAEWCELKPYRDSTEHIHLVVQK